MIETYFTDEITLITDSFDEWGVKTSTETTGVKARVEDNNRIIKDLQGREVKPDMMVLCGSDNNITNQTRIKVTIKGGVAYDLPNKEWDIKKKGIQTGFTKSHWEIML